MTLGLVSQLEGTSVSEEIPYLAPHALLLYMYLQTLNPLRPNINYRNSPEWYPYIS